MRTLSTNSAVIATFINQSLFEARNSRASVWFKGDKLYSYQSHLATIMPDRTLFINSELISYSNTTSKHIAYLRNIATDSQFFTIPLDLQTNEVLNWYWDQVETFISKYLRARTTKDYHKLIIRATLGLIEQYVDYMGIDRTSPEYMRKHTIVQQLFKHQIL